MVRWTRKVVRKASASLNNQSECHVEGRAQSAVGFRLERYTLRLCAASAHMIHLKTPSRRYQNGPMDTESGSKGFGLFGQPIRVPCRGSCTIGCGRLARKIHFEAVCSSSTQDSPRSTQQAIPEWSDGHGKWFKGLRPLRTTNPSAMLTVVHNQLWALGSKHTL